ncbi:hypothetical protein ACROYT_G020703 [Oculina patagonica]
MRILCFLSDSSCKLDLGLVVDTTKSIKAANVPKLKKALTDLVKQFAVAEDGTHVSFQTFAKESVIHNYFNDANYYSEEAVLALIDNGISKLTKPTRLDKALQMADEEMFTEESGDRPGVRSVMVLFTDGRSHPRQTDVEKYRTDVQDMKSKGVRLVVVAIGPDAEKAKYQTVLYEIGGKNVFFVRDYSELDKMISNITNIICPPNPCENSPGLDVAFVVDRTESIGLENFRLVKGFLLELCDALTIGPNATHTGYILFARKPNLLNTFADTQYYSGASVHQLITNIPEELGDRTYIDRALKKADDALFTVQGGDRPEFPNVLILLTDGRTNKNSEPFSSIIPSLEAKDVRIVAIGVGKYEDFEGELEEIAGDNVYNATNFDELSDLFDQILAETCSVDGGFSIWSSWSDCSEACGDGYQTRTRTCTNPPPQGNGKDCEGHGEESRQCNDGPCPARDLGLFEYKRLPKPVRDWDDNHIERREPSDPEFFKYKRRYPKLERDWDYVSRYQLRSNSALTKFFQLQQNKYSS